MLYVLIYLPNLLGQATGKANSKQSLHTDDTALALQSQYQERWGAYVVLETKIPQVLLRLQPTLHEQLLSAVIRHLRSMITYFRNQVAELSNYVVVYSMRNR